VNFLLLNINNSYTKFAPSTATRLNRMDRIPTPRVNLTWLTQLKRKYPRHQLILSSVVPFKTTLGRRVFGKSFFAISGLEDLGIGIDFPRKEQIGADRLANAAAAVKIYGYPAIVIDFGTALTFDVINHRGHYAGGAIAPGLNAITEYLYQRTALLPRLLLKEPKRAVGKSTEEAMRVGAITGYRGLVLGILNAMRKELGYRRIKLIATGGQAALMVRGLKEIKIVNPLLTLEGLRIIAAYRNKLPHGKSNRPSLR
jgi:type III pantothenate kinase